MSSAIRQYVWWKATISTTLYQRSTIECTTKYHRIHSNQVAIDPTLTRVWRTISWGSVTSDLRSTQTRFKRAHFSRQISAVASCRIHWWIKPNRQYWFLAPIDLVCPTFSRLNRCKSGWNLVENAGVGIIESKSNIRFHLQFTCFWKRKRLVHKV